MAEQETRRVISLSPDRPRGNAPVKKDQNKTKGHEAFLKALQLSNADIVVEMISSGRIYFGKLKHSDKYTLTIRVSGVVSHPGEAPQLVNESYDHVLFKHDISEFYTTTAPQFPARQAGAAQ